MKEMLRRIERTLAKKLARLPVKRKRLKHQSPVQIDTSLGHFLCLQGAKIEVFYLSFPELSWQLRFLFFKFITAHDYSDEDWRYNKEKIIKFFFTVRFVHKKGYHGLYTRGLPIMSCIRNLWHGQEAD